MNIIHSIGYTGLQKCYFNMPKAEAIKRYLSEHREHTKETVNEMIDTIEFNAEFGAYSIWEEE